MAVVRANGIDVYYECSGTGEPLLLIAGFGCDHAIWTLVAAELAASYRVYLFDNRGLGQSTGADSVASIHQMAGDAAALMEALDLGRVHLAGHSMGGMIAQELALMHPNWVRSLVLLSSCSHQDNRGKAIIRSWGELPSLLDIETSTRLILPWIYTEAFYADPVLIENLIAVILANPAPPDPKVLKCQAKAIMDFDSSERLAGIRCPTLVIVGEQDILLPPSAAGQLARGILSAELLVLEGTGHGLLVETPQRVAQAMQDFLSRQA
jgi:3-oxoadipate enol-lactonase